MNGKKFRQRGGRVNQSETKSVKASFNQITKMIESENDLHDPSD